MTVKDFILAMNFMATLGQGFMPFFSIVTTKRTVFFQNVPADKIPEYYNDKYKTICEQNICQVSFSYFDNNEIYFDIFIKEE